MSVNNLETPERGVNLQTRAAKRAKQTDETIMGAVAPVVALRERIAAARVVEPEGGFRCCSHCAQAFISGRDRAIKVIEGE